MDDIMTGEESTSREQTIDSTSNIEESNRTDQQRRIIQQNQPTKESTRNKGERERLVKILCPKNEKNCADTAKKNKTQVTT